MTLSDCLIHASWAWNGSLSALYAHHLAVHLITLRSDESIDITVQYYWC